MKKFLIPILIMNLGFISAAWATPQNLVECHGSDDEGNQLRVKIHQDEGGELVALVSGDDFNWSGGFETLPYKIDHASDQEYSGPRIALKLEGKEGFLTVTDLDINEQKLTCNNL